MILPDPTRRAELVVPNLRGGGGRDGDVDDRHPPGHGPVPEPAPQQQLVQRIVRYNVMRRVQQ